MKRTRFGWAGILVLVAAAALLCSGEKKASADPPGECYEVLIDGVDTGTTNCGLDGSIGTHHDNYFGCYMCACASGWAPKCQPNEPFVCLETRGGFQNCEIESWGCNATGQCVRE